MAAGSECLGQHSQRQTHKAPAIDSRTCQDHHLVLYHPYVFLINWLTRLMYEMGFDILQGSFIVIQVLQDNQSEPHYISWADAHV